MIILKVMYRKKGFGEALEILSSFRKNKAKQFAFFSKVKGKEKLFDKEYLYFYHQA